MHVVGQLAGLPDIVAQHRKTLRVELQTEPRHVALDHCCGDDGFVPRSGAGMADLRPNGRGGEKHQADADRRQHHRGGGRPLDIVVAVGMARAGMPLTGGQQPRHDLQCDRGGAATDQHDRRRQQWNAAQPDQRQKRAIGLAGSHHAPGESAERDRRLQPLLSRPQHREPDRPAGKLPHHDGQQTENPGKQRAHQHQRQQRYGADEDADPVDQRQVERQAEQEAVTESAQRCGGRAGQHPGQHGKRDDGGPPPVEPGIARAEQQTGKDCGAKACQARPQGFAELR